MGPIEQITRELGWQIALKHLAANLAIGAALCRAERLGYQRGVHDAWSFMGDDKIEAWRSGCQRPAPGTGSGESR